MTDKSSPSDLTTANLTGSLEYSHPLEKWLKKDWLRLLLRKITEQRPGTASVHLERALLTYADPDAPLHERVAYWPIHKVLDKMRGSLSPAELAAKIGGHSPTLRGIIATSRSVARYGLTIPQRWEHPLFIVWNFTNRCNLSCKHCYQSSSNKIDQTELTLQQKLDFIDQFGSNYGAMIAFAGGEPTLSADLNPCLARAQKYGIHTTLATHGGLLTRDRCQELAQLGMKYVEVSLDSIDPEKHDNFRGISGMWKKSVEGIKNVVATQGMRAGVAMCVTRENYHEVEDMLKWAVDMGISCFAHFNFIPVGRGRQIADLDITPQQREELLILLHKWMQSRKIGVISTAPQLGRVCLVHAGEEGLMSCSHAGNGPGTKARVVAKYLGGCGAGRTYACLQPNGDVTPCVYMPERLMGNIKDKSLTDVFQGSQWWDLLCDRNEREGNCGKCHYRNYCGGCRARSDAYFGRLDHSDPGCINNQDLWEQLTNSTGEKTVVQVANQTNLYNHLYQSSSQ